MGEHKNNTFFENLKSFASGVKDVALNKQDEAKTKLEEKRTERIFDKYSPIFREDVENGELLSERVIRIVNFDTRLKNEHMKDSIGFWEISKDRRIPTLYYKYASSLGLTFYPHQSESVYISDPCISGKYIEIDSYYDYMKKARVDELELVAQSLGARSVVVELSADKNTLFHKSATSTGEISASVSGKADYKREKKKRRTKTIEIWTSTEFKSSVFSGNPKEPDLVYFRNDSVIATLIKMVIENKNKPISKNYKMKASSSFGVSSNEAASISNALKKIKSRAGMNFNKSFEEQENAYLEYTIEF